MKNRLKLRDFLNVYQGVYSQLNIIDNNADGELVDTERVINYNTYSFYKEYYVVGIDVSNEIRDWAMIDIWIDKDELLDIVEDGSSEGDQDDK